MYICEENNSCFIQNKFIPTSKIEKAIHFLTSNDGLTVSKRSWSTQNNIFFHANKQKQLIFDILKQSEYASVNKNCRIAYKINTSKSQEHNSFSTCYSYLIIHLRMKNLLKHTKFMIWYIQITRRKSLFQHLTTIVVYICDDERS